MGVQGEPMGVSPANTGVRQPYGGEIVKGSGKTPLSRAACGRLGGAPIRTGSVESIDGATLSSVHVARLRKLADKAAGRDRDHLLAAIACIQTLTRKNRRLGAKVGATARRKALTHRGVELSGPVENIAQEIVELANDRPVTAYRLPRRRVRVTVHADLPGTASRHRIGTYDVACDYRAVLDDVREALAA